MSKALTPRTLTPGNDGTVPIQAIIPVDGEARDSYNSLEVPIQALIDVLGFLQGKVATLGDAQALLAKLKTVDGQGSLLDADLLDGKSSLDLVSPANLGFVSGTGHVQLPNGEIFQWGRVDFGAGNYAAGQFNRRAFSWPIPFPNAVEVITPGLIGGLAPGTYSSISCESQTLTGAQMVVVYGANVSLQPLTTFFAVGK